MAEYVRNLWYMAGWEAEVADGGWLARRLLDRPWLIYRTSDGDYAMIADRCPHRFAPLSRGRRDGDTIVCGYHGLGFDATGACKHSPFGKTLPDSVRVATLPVVARYGALWFWPGDTAQADPAHIPDFAFMADTSEHVPGHMMMNANYELIADNLMDLSHVEFLHVESFGVSGELFTGKHSVKQDADGAIWNKWDMTNIRPQQWIVDQVGEGVNVDSELHMRWHAPAAMALRIGNVRAGDSSKTPVVPPMLNPHILTPETQTATHYFFTHGHGDFAAELAR
ncbi:MAG: Rieske 2Fe-2S domain-containing protein, partial [Alphaproteobacteria bacterium]|nr:Rieske 2Fe-2S domain-containing protein [Alphaproteobacteria bacterium]